MSSLPAANDSIRSIRLRGDRLLRGLCCVLWFVSLGFAPLHGEWIAWALCATFLVLAAAFFYALIPGTRGSRICLGLCLMGFAALMVHESHGVIETHFAFFILLAALLYYRDWRPILVSALSVAVQHLLFCWLQMHGYPVFLFEQHHAMSMVFVHAAYIVAEAALLIVLALTIRREALESSAIAAFGERISASQTLDLSFDSAFHKGAAARGLLSLLAALRSIAEHSTSLALRIVCASEDIALSSGRIRTVTQTQTHIVDQISRSVETMAEAESRIKDDCAAVARVAGHSATIIQEGCTTMQHTEQLMLTVSQMATSTVTGIDQLQTESARIKTIVRIMNDLSNQSSLLALNASIEAARAGEKGKGFQVVAQEIRTLSERSYQSLAEVQTIVDIIGQRVTQLQAHAHRCQSAATEGGSQVKAARAAFTEVAQHLPDVAERAHRVVETADEHTSLSAEVLAGMSRIGAAILQNTTEMKNFAGLSASLEQMSEELSTNVNQIKTAPQPA